MILYKQVRSVLNRHKKRDSWFLDDYSVNPYEGCGFNCLYCYVRGSKYGEQLAEKLTVKENAPQILDRQLANRARKGEYGIISLGSATDAYMQVEETERQTRKLLEIIKKHRFPVFISTKSTLIERDIDLLLDIDRHAILPPDLQQSLHRGAIICFSFSTLDQELAAWIEPGAPAPAERLRTMKKISDAGLLTGLNALPLLPWIGDTPSAIDALFVAAKEHGAEFVLGGGLTLYGDQPGDGKTLFYRFLRNHYPDLLEKYRHLYGSQYYQPWQYQEELKQRLDKASRQTGIRDSIIQHAKRN